MSYQVIVEVQYRDDEYSRYFPHEVRATKEEAEKDRDTIFLEFARSSCGNIISFTTDVVAFNNYLVSVKDIKFLHVSVNEIIE